MSSRAYRLEEMIGHGGMSIVYRARHLVLERSVALKLLAPELSDDPAFQERFIRESRLAAALDHPNVIPIYEAGEENGVFYIAMRYVPGSNLKELLQRDGPLDRAQTISVIGQIASALNAAHEMGLVHRDVKPANVLIVEGAGADDSNHVYLSDFGIAKQQSSNVTRTGMFIGTAEYASPEQIEGKDLDGRSDVYSLGCVLYQCLTGNPAFEKDSEVALIYAHLLESPPSTRAARPGPPAGDRRSGRQGDGEEAGRPLRDREGSRGGGSAGAGSAGRAESGRRPPEAVAAASTPEPAAMTSAPASVADAAAAPAATSPVAPASPPATPPPAAEALRPRTPRRRPPEARRESAASGSGSRRRRRARHRGRRHGRVAFGGGGGKRRGGTRSRRTQQQQTGPCGPVTLLAALMPTGIAAQCKTAGDRELRRRPDRALPPARQCSDVVPADVLVLVLPQPRRAPQRLRRPEEHARASASAAPTQGEKAWIHLSTGKTGGVRVCGNADNGDSMVIWTHEKLGNFDHVDMLGVARASGRGANLFRSWWGAIKDDVGKCRPLLPTNVCNATVQHFEKSK